MSNNRAVCLISGGLDSCVMVFIAKTEGYEIYTLSFNYGQIHRKELEHAGLIAKAAGSKKHLVCNLDK
ncbi:MAG: 7-cyano-7-deazaguanine synthase, partial [Candidatus Thermoplasmatota archaeon]